MILKMIFFTSIHSLVHDLILVSLTLLLWRRRWLRAARSWNDRSKDYLSLCDAARDEPELVEGAQGEEEGFAAPPPLPCPPRALLLC